MRSWLGPLAVASGVLAGCHAPEPTGAARERAAADPSPRLTGLWQQTLTRDGVAPPMISRTRLCLDRSSVSDLEPLASGLGRRACAKTAERRVAAGVELFAMRCELGEGGVSDVSGRITRPSPVRYQIHEESLTRGAAMAALNGRHAIDLDALWLGPCPPDMKPGEVALPGGLRVNLARAAAAAALLGGGR